MIHKQPGASWPFVCILVCLFVLSAISPSLWNSPDEPDQTAHITQASPSSLAIQTPNSAAGVDRTVAEKKDKSAEADEEGKELTTLTDYHPVEPALKIAKNRDISDLGLRDLAQSSLDDHAFVMERLELPILRPPVRPVSRLQDIMRLPSEDMEMANATAGMPRAIHALPYRVVPVERRAYPNTGLLPLQLVPVKDEKLDHVMLASPSVQWVDPVALQGRLQVLRKEASTSQWAAQANQLVRQLGCTVSRNPKEAKAILQQLETLNAQALPLAQRLRSESLTASLLRTNHALQRRLDVWRQAFDPDSSTTASASPGDGPERLASVLAAINEATADSAQGEAWHKFLLIDDLQKWVDTGTAGRRCDPLPPELAGRILKRLAKTPMTVSQHQFITSEPLVALRRELHCSVAKPADTSQLMRYIEKYERTRLASDAKQVARDCLDLNLSLDVNHRKLAGYISEHYRNANVRVAISEAFLNRLLPPPRKPEYGKVRETVLGIPVRGKSLTSTELAIKLIPDPNHVRLALVVTGEVAALTTSMAGPATFYNDSETMYSARKPLEIDLNGIHLSPSKVAVFNRTRLRNVATNYDGVFLMEGLAKKVARSKLEQNSAAAAYEVKRKVAAQARERIDREANVQLAQASERLRQRVIAPMETLGLGPTMIQAKTTRDRLSMRLRLAGEDQLGGTTARPRAPSDSLVSFQIHETAINNAIEHLGLDGRTFTLAELSRLVSKKFHFEKPWQVETNHDNVTITFAARDAVTVRCEGGRIVITLSIARLRKAPRNWRNFQIRAVYQPEVKGRSAQLVRDGVLHLMGKRMSIGTQIPIRGVFAKVFSKNRPIPLIPQRLTHDKNMSDLAITQFTIADGWIGLALGPRRTEQTASWPRSLWR